MLVNGWSRAGHTDSMNKIDTIDNIDKIDNVDKFDDIDKIENIDKIDNIHKIDNMDHSPSSVGQVLFKCWPSVVHVLENGSHKGGSY